MQSQYAQGDQVHWATGKTPKREVTLPDGTTATEKRPALLHIKMIDKQGNSIFVATADGAGQRRYLPGQLDARIAKMKHRGFLMEFMCPIATHDVYIEGAKACREYVDDMQRPTEIPGKRCAHMRDIVKIRQAAQTEKAKKYAENFVNAQTKTLDATVKMLELMMAERAEKADAAKGTPKP